MMIVVVGVEAALIHREVEAHTAPERSKLTVTEVEALVEEEPEEGVEQLVVKEPCVEEELLQE